VTPDLVLGLDGGGSKTELAIADMRGTVLAFERGIGLDPLADPEWETTLRQLLRRAAGLLPFTRRCALALPAYGEAPAVSARQAEVVARALTAEHILLNDVHAAQIGAFAGGPGVLLLAGTGSMVWSVDRDGRSSRVGGWGDAFGDEGSGFWVGREALSLATRGLDGRADAAAFARGLLERIGVEPDGLLAWCWSLPNRRAGIAALAGLVDIMAAGGDAQAADLLARAADHLVAHVRAAGASVRGGLPWSFAGGLFNSGTVSLHATARLGPPQTPALPPVGGAVLHAARAAGWDAGPDWVANLAEGLIGNVTRH
jgi:N-acetylglucosamine kinase-like BadF-type ATPase